MKGRFFRTNVIVSLVAQAILLFSLQFADSFGLPVALVVGLGMIGQFLYALIYLSINGSTKLYSQTEIWLTIAYLLLVVPLLCTGVFSLQRMIRTM